MRDAGDRVGWAIRPNKWNYATSLYGYEHLVDPLLGRMAQPTLNGAVFLTLSTLILFVHFSVFFALKRRNFMVSLLIS